MVSAADSRRWPGAKLATPTPVRRPTWSGSMMSYANATRDAQADASTWAWRSINPGVDAAEPNSMGM